MVKQSLQRLRFLARTVMRTERDALDWLEADHIKVETLFFLARIIPNRRRRAEIFQRIRSELLQHGALEKKVFYPACSRIPELRSLVEESLLEHGQIENLLGEIVTLGNAEHAQARIRVLMEEVEHHVNLEENDLFPKVRSLMPQAQFNTITREIRRIKEGQVRAPRRTPLRAAKSRKKTRARKSA